MELSVSLLNANDKQSMVKKLNNTKISYFHIDVMDGKFVSYESFPIEDIYMISNITKKPLDVHLMVENPSSLIDKLTVLPNINNITLHLEINKDINSLLEKIKKCGIKRGISIKPNTDISLLEPYLNNIDIILIMSVEPGLGGQSFIEETTERIKKIKEMTRDYNIVIEVDGGINDKTIKKVSLSDIVVVGTFITSSDEVEKKVNKLIV